MISSVIRSRSFSTSSAVSRWYKDQSENREWFRFGYKDKVKRSGPLPRLDNDAKKYEDQPIFEPEAPYAPKRALYGQNDYIDILGENPDALKPHDIHYHMPKYLRGMSGYDNDYQQALKIKAALSETAVSEVKPKDWDFLTKRIWKRYKEFQRHADQNSWKNYKGIRSGPVKDQYATKFK